MPPQTLILGEGRVEGSNLISSMNKIVERAKSPTPVFFKRIRNISLTLTAIAGVILTAPISLPAAIVTGAGYIAVAGSIASAVSQLTSSAEELAKTPKPGVKRKVNASK